MKKLFFGTLLLALVILFPIPTMARVSIDLPPPIAFATPLEMIVLPETYVYAAPGLDEDIFFYNGSWWRPWKGRWYRSQYYNSGWGYYQSVPSFYRWIPSGWRNDYRAHRWKGHQWNYKRIPHQQIQKNWREWEKSRHWEKQETWGVQGLRPKTQSEQPSRKVKPQKSRPQLREVKPERSQQQHREVGPQSQNGQPQHSQQQQGKHEKGKVAKKDKR